MGDFKFRDPGKSKGRWSKKSDDRGSSRRDSGRSERRGSGGFNRRSSESSGGFNRRDSGRFGGRSSDRSEMTKVICATCNKECEVPFKPTSNKPVYCSDCFKKDSGSSTRSSGSKDYGKEFEEINQKLDKIMEALENTKKPVVKAAKIKKDSKTTKK
ncbi:CxxC-x17-CxxC domain-containing protein [Nanoarchaeota archaeon]